MFWNSDKLKMPAASEALPGREETMPVPERHFVNGARLTEPFPAGSELALFGLGCFWGAERKFWQVPGVISTSVGYSAGQTKNPTYKEVCSGRTGHNEVVRVVFDPAKVSYEQLLRVFFESHDPTQGMRQGNDVGTQYRSGIYATSAAQKEKAKAVRDAFDEKLQAKGIRPHHDRNRGRTAVLLRRGVSPAVSGEEPERLLRPRRHRRVLPGRDCGRQSVKRSPRGPGLSRSVSCDRAN
jgi:peptide-methionine (S)-S-oxide reductase